MYIISNSSTPLLLAQWDQSYIYILQKCHQSQLDHSQRACWCIALIRQSKLKRQHPARPNASVHIKIQHHLNSRCEKQTYPVLANNSYTIILPTEIWPNTSWRLVLQATLPLLDGASTSESESLHDETLLYIKLFWPKSNWFVPILFFALFFSFMTGVIKLLKQ